MPDLTKSRRGAGTLSKFLLCTAAALAIAPAAKAQDWTGANSNDWFDAGNWSPATVPSGADEADINLTNGPVIDGAAASTAAVGVGFADSGSLSIINGGSLSSTFLIVGSGADTSGDLSVTGVGSSLSSSTIFWVGRDGHGELHVSDGATASSTGASVGVFATGSGLVEVTGDGSEFLGLNAIGVSGHGSLIVADGASAFSTNSNFALAQIAGSIGDVTITGPNSAFFNGSPTTFLGAAGTGHVTVEDGGSYFTANTVLGDAATGSGTVDVTGTDSSWSNSGNLTVGNSGTGHVTISDGGGLTVSSSSPPIFTLGANAGAIGTLTVTGAGSTVTDNSDEMRIGDAGEGHLTIANGGTLVSGVNWLGLSAGGTGTASVTGNGSSWTSFVIGVGLGGDGDVTVSNGGLITANGILRVGPHSGRVTVGNGGEIDAETIEVTATDQGLLTVEKGGVVHSTLALVLGQGFGNVGDIAVNGGTLTAQTLDVGLNGDASIEITNGGTVSTDIAGGAILGIGTGTGRVLVSGRGSTLSTGFFPGVIVGAQGAGELVVQNGGAVNTFDFVIADSPGSTGRVVIGGETTPVAPGTLSTFHVEFGSGDGELDFNHTSANYIFAPQLTSTGISGHVEFLAGTTTLTGDSSNFFGVTNIESGASAFFNGSIKGDISVFGGGFAGGDGTIAGMFVDSGGTLSPGASATSIGTLNALAITFAPGSVYRPKVDAAGNSDLLNVSGSFAIDGGTVAVAPQPGAYAHTTTYTIATTALGPLGVFDNVTSSLGFLVPTLDYVGNDIQLTLTVDDHVFTTAPITPNQINTAAAIKTMATDNPVWLGVVELNDSDARDALNALSGNFLASLNGGGFNEPLQLFSTVQSRLLGIAEGPRAVQLASLADVGGVSAERRGVWGQIFGGVSSIDGDANASGLDLTRGGLIVGADRGVGVDGRVGVSASYQRTNAEADGRVSEGDINSYGVSLYGGTKAGNFSVTGEVGYSLRDVSARRHVVAGLLDETLHADYNANALHAQVRVGLPLEFGSSVVEPFGSVALVRVNTEGFTEKGGSAALTSGDSDNSVVFTSLGARVMHGFGPDGRNGGLFGSLAWRHASGDVAPDQRFAFTSNPSATFAVTGAPIAEDAAALEAGFRAVLGPRTNMTIGYRGEFGDGSQDHTASVRFSFTH